MESRNEKRMLGAACRYAYSRLVLNHYLFYENFSEGVGYSEKQLAFGRKYLELLGRFLKGAYPVDELEKFRRQVVDETEIIVAYLGCFQIFEYALNRLEGRFSAEKMVLEDDDSLADEMMDFILSAKEGAEGVERIKMILGELPLRFTRAKFFSIIMEALSVYEGTDKKSLETAILMLRAEALLNLPDHMQEEHEKLDELLQLLRRGNYKNPGREEFSQLRSSLTLAEEILARESSDGLSMIGLVNDLDIVCLTRQDTLMDSQDEKLFQAILSGTPGNEAEELLIQMEGKQEHYYEQWSRYQADQAEGSEDPILWKVNRLLSDSSFMSLERDDKEETGILLSRKAVEELCRPLLEDMEKNWKALPKALVRALMARILVVLPMFFTTPDEVRQFILGCLSSCTDLPEKYASVQLIRMLMESENALV